MGCYGWIGRNFRNFVNFQFWQLPRVGMCDIRSYITVCKHHMDKASTLRHQTLHCHRQGVSQEFEWFATARGWDTDFRDVLHTEIMLIASKVSSLINLFPDFLWVNIESCCPMSRPDPPTVGANENSAERRTEPPRSGCDPRGPNGHNYWTQPPPPPGC